MTVADQLLEFVNTEVSLDPGQTVVGATDLLLTGLVDSLGVIRIVHWMEDELGIEVDPADVVLDNFQTVDQMLAYVERRRATVA